MSQEGIISIIIIIIGAITVASLVVATVTVVQIREEGIAERERILAEKVEASTPALPTEQPKVAPVPAQPPKVSQPVKPKETPKKPQETEKITEEEIEEAEEEEVKEEEPASPSVPYFGFSRSPRSSPPPDTTPPIISNINVSDITFNSALVSWYTDETSDSVVEYGLTSDSYEFSAFGDTAASESVGFIHAVSLSGLDDNATYFYKVSSTDKSDNQNKAESSEDSFLTLIDPPIVASYVDNQMVSKSADFDLITEGIQINLSGTAEPDSTIIIEQNPIHEASVSEEGAWSHVVDLNEGENDFEITNKIMDGEEIINISPETSLDIFLDSIAPEALVSILGFNYASSSIAIQWSSPEYPSVSFDVEYKEGAGEWLSLLEGTSETQTSFITENQDVIYYFRAQAQDSLGNPSDWQEASIEILSSPIVINEIAWMGTLARNNDEWVELYNRADYDIDLTGWTFAAEDGTPNITLTINSPAQEYLLLERGSNDKAVFNIPADQLYTLNALGNNGEDLKIKDVEQNVIDRVDCSDVWYAGDNDEKRTMERISVDVSGSDPSNWQTYLGSGSDAIDVDGNPIFGTPQAQNSQ